MTNIVFYEEYGNPAVNWPLVIFFIITVILFVIILATNHVSLSQRFAVALILIFSAFAISLVLYRLWNSYDTGLTWIIAIFTLLGLILLSLLLI